MELPLHDATVVAPAVICAPILFFPPEPYAWQHPTGDSCRLHRLSLTDSFQPIFRHTLAVHEAHTAVVA
jgi:hypothetical protein